MRCLTLADALRDQGAECRFVCREHQGNLIEYMHWRGYKVHGLPTLNEIDMEYSIVCDESIPVHASWLGCDWCTDAEQTMRALDNEPMDWLIVDHYALDVNWERTLRPTYLKLMVIDDLADRLHDCDLLLDQNLGRQADDYVKLVSTGCKVFIGPSYALLRSEFCTMREYSLRRRSSPELKHLLISMGGVDKDNATGRVLEALKLSALPEGCRITVVMGSTAPWLDSVRKQAVMLRWPIEVKVNVSNMAQLMAESDLAVGAAGSSSWERCCLGLPSVMVILAENQNHIANALHMIGAGVCIGSVDSPSFNAEMKRLISRFSCAPALMSAMSKAGSEVTDGRGCDVVSELLLAMVVE